MQASDSDIQRNGLSPGSPTQQGLMTCRSCRCGRYPARQLKRVGIWCPFAGPTAKRSHRNKERHSFFSEFAQRALARSSSANVVDCHLRHAGHTTTQDIQRHDSGTPIITHFHRSTACVRRSLPTSSSAISAYRDVGSSRIWCEEHLATKWDTMKRLTA